MYITDWGIARVSDDGLVLERPDVPLPEIGELANLMRWRIEDTPEQAAFRDQFLAWLRDNLPEGWLEALDADDDEALEILTVAWSGAPVHHRGRHYTYRGVPMELTPVQAPHPPVLDLWSRAGVLTAMGDRTQGPGPTPGPCGAPGCR